jgi:L-seryl-tRNA(Ser) seleniumtransferase
MTANEVPTHQMIAASYEDIRTRAENFIARVDRDQSGKTQLQIVDGESAIGGGAAPTSRLRTALIAIGHANFSANQIEERLRRHNRPVIARIENDQVLLDLRTVLAAEEGELLDAIITLARAE